jgi:hypothetical protein
MLPIESFKNTLFELVEVLNRQQIPFHLTGGITGIAYGELREMIVGELSRSQAAEIFGSVRHA